MPFFSWQTCHNSGLKDLQESCKDPSESVFCVGTSQERQVFGTISPTPSRVAKKLRLVFGTHCFVQFSTLTQKGRRSACMFSRAHKSRITFGLLDPRRPRLAKITLNWHPRPGTIHRPTDPRRPTEPLRADIRLGHHLRQVFSPSRSASDTGMYTA